MAVQNASFTSSSAATENAAWDYNPDGGKNGGDDRRMNSESPAAENSLRRERRLHMFVRRVDLVKGSAGESHAPLRLLADFVNKTLRRRPCSDG